MPVTPVYGWPYQPRGAAPGLSPEAIEALALRMEATLSAIDARLAAAEAVTAVSPYRDVVTLSGNASQIDFFNIPSTLREVRVSWTARTDAAAHTTDVYCRINNDSAALYSHAILYSVNGGTPGAGNAIGATSGQVGACMGGSATAGKFGAGNVTFSGWNAPHSACLAGFGHGGAVSALSNSVMVDSEFTYLGAAPYTRITLLPLGGGNFVSGSGFYLEGLR